MSFTCANREILGNLNSMSNDFVESIRRANVGLVMMSTMLICALVGQVKWGNRLCMALAFHGSALWLNSYLGMEPKRTLVYTLISKAVEIYLVLKVNRTDQPYMLLTYATIANAVSFVAAPMVPSELRSATFHFINALSTYLAWQSMRSFPAAALVEAWPIYFKAIVIGVALGFFFVLKTSRLSLNQARLVVTGSIWNVVYFIILFRGFADPVPARTATPNDPSRVNLLPYRDNVPKASPLGVPNADAIPERQKIDYTAIRLVFKIVSFLDQYMPQARVSEPLTNKPRIRMDVTPDYYIPSLVKTKMIEMPMGIPQALKDAANSGADIAWLVLHGHISPMLRKMPPTEELGRDYRTANEEGCTHVVDLDYMSKYETHPDFISYGGKAFFTATTDELALKFLTLPGEDTLIKAKLHDGAYEKARMAFLATTSVTVVAGYHLAGIHMMYDLVSVALFNAFDHRSAVHPFRALMQLHFFNHTMVDVATTPHLMERGAVFTQIWALTHAGICDFVEDFFRTQIDFGAEDDVEARITVLGEELSGNSQLCWMREYRKIYTYYAKTTIDAIYPDENGPGNDEAIKKFYDHLNTSLGVTAGDGLRGYGTLSNKRDLVKFLADAIFHVTVVHEMHGTKTPSYALNPQLMQVKVAKDLSPPAREDYNSLLMVSAATGRVKFPRLLEQDPQHVFATVDDAGQKDVFIKAFSGMLKELNALEARIRSRVPQEDMLRMYVLPSDLKPGAGY